MLSVTGLQESPLPPTIQFRRRRLWGCHNPLDVAAFPRIGYKWQVLRPSPFSCAPMSVFARQKELVTNCIRGGAGDWRRRATKTTNEGQCSYAVEIQCISLTKQTTRWGTEEGSIAQQRHPHQDDEDKIDFANRGAAAATLQTKRTRNAILQLLLPHLKLLMRSRKILLNSLLPKGYCSFP